MAGIQIDGVNNKIDFDDDADTSISSATDDTLVIESGGVNIASITAGEFAINEGSGSIDFRVESDDDANMLLVDASNNSIGVGTNSPALANGRGIVVHGGSSVARVELRNDTSGAADSDGMFLTYSGTDAFVGNREDGTIQFWNNGSERARIDGEGDFMVGISSASSRLLISQPNNNTSFGNLVTNASYSNHVNYWQTGRAGSTAFNFAIAISNVDSSNDTEFRIQGTGATQSDGAYSGTGVDFGEYFEWADGNSSDEVRYGYSVVLDGNKIRKATAEDNTTDIIGIISAHPTIIGDGDIDKWNKKYLRDDFNKPIMEEYTVTTWTETTYDKEGASPSETINYPTDAIPSDVTVPTEDVKDSEGRVIKTKAVVVTTEDDGVTKLKRKKLNPDWDSSLTYIPREERKEWDVVGLVGKLRMHKGQPTNPNWRKMRDISDSVEEWLVR